MIVLVLSDVHANLEALEAVLAHAPPYDAVWMLGDSVGYGPDPNAVVARLESLDPEYWLAGNHDQAALSRLDLVDFNPDARRAAKWTAETLNSSSALLLAALEPRAIATGLDISLVHGSPRQPIWEYILDARTAMESFQHFDESTCFFGHTHVPAVYQHEIDGALRIQVAVDQSLTAGGRRWLINPGSVGQPRDGDPRASFATFRTEDGRVTFHRAAYDIERVQAKILKAGLPSRLAARLDFGM